MIVRCDKNINIGVAVSGGADSMVLLTLLHQSGNKVVAINIDHNIRGAESQADSQFVADYCKQLNIPLLSFSVDAPSFATQKAISLESSARELRYEIFDNLIASKKVDVVALAHHASDQTETILMRLLRGTGVRGLRGITDRAGYIHPLLSYNKAEIITYAKANNIPWVTDSTNADSAYTRNFLRNDVIPVLQTRYAHLDKSIARLTTTMAEVEDFLLSETTPYIAKNDTVELPLSALDRHPAIAKKSIVQCFVALGVLADIEYTLLNNIVALKYATTNSQLDATHNVLVIKGHTSLIFSKKKEVAPYCKDFDISETYCYNGKVYSFTKVDKMVAGVSFDADKVPSGAVIRTRTMGDQFKRFGGGNKSLSDYLTDIKMPLLDRQNLLVLALDSTVYAILGIEISQHLKIDKTTKNIYKIKTL